MRDPYVAERCKAINRGMDFIYHVARDPENFAGYGGDLLSCFHFISLTSKDAGLRRLARKMGRGRARQWRRDYPTLPADYDADTVIDLLYGTLAASGLGVPGKMLDRQIRRSAGDFTAEEYLNFDPRCEPPP